MIPLSVFSNRHCGGGVQDIGTFGFFFLSVGALVNEDEKKNKKVQTRAHVGANRSLFILLIGATSHKNNFLHAGRKEIYILCFSLHFFFSMLRFDVCETSSCKHTLV